MEPKGKDHWWSLAIKKLVSPTLIGGDKHLDRVSGVRTGLTDQMLQQQRLIASIVSIIRRTRGRTPLTMPKLVHFI